DSSALVRAKSTGLGLLPGWELGPQGSRRSAAEGGTALADPIIVNETPEPLAERVAADFAALVTDVLQRQERFTVALAGGQTPKLFYQRLAKEPYKSSIPWSRLWIFWGDERCVPKEHPDSNFRMASEALLQYVPVAPAHVFRMRGEDPPPSAARDYE